MKTIYYRVAVSEDEEQDFLKAMGKIKRNDKMCEKVLSMLKSRKYAYLENLNCNRYASPSYRRLMEVKISVVTEIIEEIEEEQKQDAIIIA